MFKFKEFKTSPYEKGESHTAVMSSIAALLSKEQEYAEALGGSVSNVFVVTTSNNVGSTITIFYNVPEKAQTTKRRDGGGGL